MVVAVGYSFCHSFFVFSLSKNAKGQVEMFKNG